VHPVKAHPAVAVAAAGPFSPSSAAQPLLSLLLARCNCIRAYLAAGGEKSRFELEGEEDGTREKEATTTCEGKEGATARHGAGGREGGGRRRSALLTGD
jgi:hypothetical protein